MYALAVAVPRAQVDPLALAPALHPVPGLGGRYGARARPLRLTNLIPSLGVPDLNQAQVLHLASRLLLRQRPEGRDTRARAREVLCLRARRSLEAIVPAILG